MPPEPARPTPEMVAFFTKRTREHIDRVRRCLAALADAFPQHAEALRARGIAHDRSKYSPEEREPYIWLTEFHRCRRLGLPFTYPPGVEERVQAAIRHHLQGNRHHTRFHADPNDMSEVDLIEMVCDWTAMSLEYGGRSARPWADAMIGTRFRFNDEVRELVYRVIGELERRLP